MKFEVIRKATFRFRGEEPLTLEGAEKAKDIALNMGLTPDHFLSPDRSLPDIMHGIPCHVLIRDNTPWYLVCDSTTEVQPIFHQLLVNEDSHPDPEPLLAA